MSLLRNAAVSIRLGLQDYADQDEDRLVSSIRNIHAGILLLYKERLRRLSPTDSNEVLLKLRIKPVISSTGVVTFVGEGRKTVDIQTIKERFAGLGIDVSWRRLDAIARIRNEIEHYYTSALRETVNQVIAESFMLIRDFLRDELHEDPINGLGAESWQQMTEIAEVYERERQECLERIRHHDWSCDALREAVEGYSCDSCGSSLVEPESNERQCGIRCRSCGEKEAFEKFSITAMHDAYYDHHHITQGGDIAIGTCPHCGEDAYHIDSQICVLFVVYPSRGTR